MAPVPWLDTVCFRALNVGAANRVLDVAFPFLTSLHQRVWFVALLVVGAVAALWKGTRRARVWVLLMIAAVAVSDAVCSRVIKPVLPRERPCQSVEHGRLRPSGFTLRVLRPEGCPGSRSFPSNHAANTASVAGIAFYLTRRRARWWWLALPVVIGWTRVYLGYHYPSDVVAGWLVGAAVAVTWVAAFRLVSPQPSGLCAGSADTAA